MAIELLKDLRELAQLEGRADQPDHLIRQLRQRYASRPAFLRRLDEAGRTV